jgi:hypothetical protein
VELNLVKAAANFSIKEEVDKQSKQTVGAKQEIQGLA